MLRPIPQPESPMEALVQFQGRLSRRIVGGTGAYERGDPISCKPSYPEKGERMGTMKEFAGLFYREGALDTKTMQLVALAAMSAAGCTS